MGKRDDASRVRWRLWTLTFVIMACLATVLVFVASQREQTPHPILLPSTRLLGTGLAGVLVAFALYVIDSERKLRRLGERLGRERRARMTLEEQESSLREFVSLVAHELRSPLTAIKGYTRMLMTKSERLSEDERRGFLATVSDQADRLTRLIEDLMDVTRIDAGTLRLVPESLDVGEVAEHLVDQFRAKWLGRPIEVARDGSLPPVRADRQRLEAILINLIDNAVKFSPEGAPVRVAIDRSNGAVAVAVSDRGPGIAPEDQPRLFEKFQRLSGASAIPGTGLGLYIVKGLVEAHGGTVRIESRAGDGSTFTFTLPAATGPALQSP